ncbi:MAG: histone-lysine N-methyltransferase, partial [Deltaproteobacteria bacterium]
ADFNVTRAGIHADGLIKNEEIYNIFDTTKILKRPIVPMVTDKSGKAGIAFWINTSLDLQGDNQVDKKHPGIAKIDKWVADEYAKGRLTSISNDELDKLVHKYLPELFLSELDKIKHNVSKVAVGVVEKMLSFPEMKSMQPELQEPIMRQIIEEHPSIQFSYVVNMDGKKTTKNITHIGDRGKYENFGVGIDQSDREWFIKPLETGKIHVTDLYISKMTGALCVTVSAPITNDNDDMVGIFGVDIKFEDWAKREEIVP